MTRFEPQSELILVVRSPNGRLFAVARGLHVLSTVALPTVVAVDAFYDQREDCAMLALRYHEGDLSRGVAARIGSIATGCDVLVLHPARMSDAEQTHLYSVQLPGCAVQLHKRPSIDDALRALAEAIGDTSFAREAKRAKPATAAPPRLESPDVLIETTPPLGMVRADSEGLDDFAQGTRENPLLSRDAAQAAMGTPTTPGPRLPGGAMPAVPKPASRPRGPSAAPTTTSTAAVPARAPRGATVPGHLRRATTDGDTTDVRGVRQIDVRYLRAGQWSPVRLRALSMKGAYLVTSALPRAGDVVHLALNLGDDGVMVRGEVFHVTSAVDAVSSGAAGFAVNFELDANTRGHLTALLKRAHELGIKLTPPPARKDMRLPVIWPMQLSGGHGTQPGEARDVSTGGMFVVAKRAMELATDVEFASTLDDGAGPVLGLARVVREVSARDAAARGLVAGVGMCIASMSPMDRSRWTEFLARVQRRNECRIMIAASPERLSALTCSLQALGYSVYGGSDAESLMQLTEAEPRPPDIALIDDGLSGAGQGWLRGVLSSRNIRCVHTTGDIRRTRIAVDRMLEVA